MAAQGKEYREIAPLCGLTARSTKNAMGVILQKFGVPSRIEAIAAAIQLGEIPCPYCKREHRFSHRAVKDHKRR